MTCPLACLILGITALLAAGPRSATAAQPDLSRRAADAPATADLAQSIASEVQDPFYAFFLEICAQDSLGVWTKDDVRDYMRRLGRRSRLPMRDLVHVERRAAVGLEAESRDGVKVSRIWTIKLRKGFHRRMPYNILGYHPGSLMISQQLVLSEWRLGNPYLRVVEDGQARNVRAQDLVAFRLDRGWIVLDVDGWLDNLLGRKLDDSWALGFATCRLEGKLHAVALGCNRQNRPLSGEFDLKADKVLPFGRPHARGLTRFTRPWLAPPAGQSPRNWQLDE